VVTRDVDGVCWGEKADTPSVSVGYGYRRNRKSALLGRLVSLILALALALSPLSDAFAKPKKSRSKAAPSIAAAIVVDMNTNEILYSKDENIRRAPASLTKMMTLYVLFSYLRAGKITLDSDLVVTPFAASQSPTKLGLKPGATIAVSDAIKALVTQSANDAAVTIAENLAGTEANFARLMTQKARSIGMNNSLFRNASGLPNNEQVTTAHDMALLARALIRDYPEYYSVFETKYFSYNGRRYRNHNKLLFGYKGTNGIKTGYTRASGFNLTASVQRDDKHLVAVVLGGKTGSQRDAAMRSLLDKYFPKASTTKSVKEELVASRQTPAPTPAPVVASAAAPPPIIAAAFGKQAPAKAAPARAQIQSLAEEEELALKAPLPQADPIITGKPGSAKSGTYHLQVGSFTSQAEAQTRLTTVKDRAAKLLDGHDPVTTTFTKDEAQWYRARFAGFSSQDSAKSTCAQLKKMSFECIVMRAE
jgi:D-alanyl-D-alanine carboxypeptidase